MSNAEKWFELSEIYDTKAREAGEVEHVLMEAEEVARGWNYAARDGDETEKALFIQNLRRVIEPIQAHSQNHLMTVESDKLITNQLFLSLNDSGVPTGLQLRPSEEVTRQEDVVWSGFRVGDTALYHSFAGSPITVPLVHPEFSRLEGAQLNIRQSVYAPAGSGDTTIRIPFLNYYRSTNEWVRKLIDIENQLAIEFLDCLQAFDREKFERYYTDSKDMFDTFTALKGLVREFDATFSHSAVERELVASAVSDVMTYGIGKVGISLGKSPHFVPPSPEVHGIVQGVGCGLDKTLYELTGDEMTARGTIALKDDNDAIHTYPLQAIESLRLID